MKPQYWDILKHSGVYGLGQLLSRMVSLVMLPLYTRFLTPADYGTIAVLDLTTTVLSILASGGLGSALTRYHTEADTPEAERTVWWTGMTVVITLSCLIVVPGLVFRGALATFALGTHESGGGFFYALVLMTLWFSLLSQVPVLYFRVRRWSWLIVKLSLVGLFLNVGLNVYFLTRLHWGISGVLTGNLITAVVMTAVGLVIVAPAWGRIRIQRRLAIELCRFGAPLVLTLLLATAMHQADRFLLRLFLDLDSVGVYSLAYQIAQGLNSLFYVPFSAIWAVVLYDIAKEPAAKATFARVFEYYVYALLLFLFGVSLFVRPLLTIFATPAYAQAAALVPIICLSFVFFSIDDHFRVPALLAKRTVSLIPGNAIGAAANIGLNVLLVPRFGVVAAAWVSVTTYAIFAGVNLVQCRRIERYDYPMGRCAAVLIAMSATLVACEYLLPFSSGAVWSLVVRAGVWTAWVAALGFSVLRQHTKPALALVAS